MARYIVKSYTGRRQALPKCDSEGSGVGDLGAKSDRTLGICRNQPHCMASTPR
jgi:hypothetical protein